MIRPHHPIPSVHRSPFNNRQNVALHPFARNIRTMPALPPRNLVDLIQKHNPRILHPVNRRPRHMIHIDQPLFFFLNQIFERLVHLHLPLLRPRSKNVRQHVLDVDVHLLNALVRHDFKRRKIPLPHINLHLTLVQFPLAQLLPQFLPRPRRRFRQRRPRINHHSSRCSTFRRPRRRRWRQQNIQQPLLRVQLGLVGNVLQLFLAHIIDRNLHQIPHHRLHIPPHIPHLRKLRSLHFQKRRIRQLRQSSRNLRLPHPRRPNHDYVFGNDFFGQVGG